MDYCRPCGCKGRRSCLICEKEYDITPTSFASLYEKENSYVYCHVCQKAWPGWETDPSEVCPNHTGKSVSISGVYVEPNFLTDNEKEQLLEGISRHNWSLSQSGRRKQNYGPKCNFKKNRIQIGGFNGFPLYSKFVHDKFNCLPILKNYNVIEQCTLEYDPKRGASIDPHIDDCWIWGERIVTVNVLGDTYLTLSKFKGNISKYNLHQVKSYPSVLDKNGCYLGSLNEKPFSLTVESEDSEYSKATIRVFMPEKSLVILFGSARYEWEHYVLREDINTLRICLAFREFTPPYLPEGEMENMGKDILKMSKEFW